LSQRRVRYDSQHVSHIANNLANFMARYGYENLETPVIEAADLFLTKAGDQIIKKLFTFERHGQELALRPEFTAPAAYHYNMQYSAEQPIVRWQFGGSVFEDDPDDFSRDYQRFSVGAELIGMSGTVAEAEIIGMAAQGVSLLGISNWRLIIGHAGLIRRLLARFGLDTRTQRQLLTHLTALRNPDLGKNYVLEQVEKQLSIPVQRDSSGNFDISVEEHTQDILDMLLDSRQHGMAMGGRTRADIARRLLQKRSRANEKSQIIAAVDFLQQWAEIDAPVDMAFAAIKRLVGSDESLATSILDWQLVIDLLIAYGIPADQVVIQPDLARSWDYYTGVVFELRTDTGLQIGGGGRYDELAHLIGGKQHVPAVGFAYYMDQILTVLPPAETAQEVKVIIRVDNENAQTVVHWAQRLRSRGITAILLPDEIDYEGVAILAIGENGSANLGQQVYSLEQFDGLVDDLKRASQ
jgi:histidyl-tRNA synthetase